MTYYISRIELRNFKSHVSSSIELPEGAIAFLGENGAGKSSILEALRVALSPPRKGPRSLQDLVNERMKGPRGAVLGNFQVKVSLKQPDDGETVTVEVQGGRASSYTLKVNGRIVASGRGSYEKELYRLLGLQYVPSPHTIIERAVIIEQGGLQRIAGLMEKGGKSLREEIEAAIGIHDIREASRRLSELEIPVEPDTGLDSVKPNSYWLRNLSAQIARNKREASQKLKEVRDARRQIEELEEEIRERRRERDRLEGEVEELKSRVDKLKTLNVELDAVKSKLEMLKTSIERLKGEYRDAVEAFKELEKLEKLSRLKPLIEELRRVRRSKEKTREELLAISRIKEDLEVVEANEPHFKRYEELSRDKQKLESKKAALEAEIARLEARLSQIASERERKYRLLSSLLSEAAARLEREINGVDELEDALKDLASRYRRAREDLEKAIQDMASLKAESEEKERILKVLELGVEKKCPVCGSPLTPEHALSLKRETLRRISEIEKRMDELKARVGEAQRLTEELEKLLSLITGIKEKAGQVVDDLSKIPDEDDIRRELERARESASKVEARIESLNEELKSLEEAWAHYISALQRVTSKTGSLDKARELATRYSQLEEVYKSLLRREEEIIGRVKLETGLDDEEQAETAIIEAYNRLPYVKEKADRLDELREELNGLQKEAEKLEGRRREIEGYIAKLGELEERLKGLEERLAAVEEEIGRLEREREGAKARAEVLAREAERLERRVKELERALDKVKTGIAIANLLERLQEALYKRSLILLENEMSRILDSFNLDPVRVEIRESGNGPIIAVITRGASERSLSMLSGGERTSIALAYVIALNKIMGSKIGFLALDEPTSELDRERRDILVNVLSGLTNSQRVISQLLVVTHHEEVMDRMDLVCRVSKREGESRVECGEQY